MKIKVNSIEELVNKAQEFAATHGVVAETKIGSSVVNSGTYVYRNGKSVRENKGWVEIELRGQNNSSTKFFLENEKESSIESLTCNQEIYQKAIQELAKHGITHKTPSPSKKNENSSDKPEIISYSAISVPCSSLEEVKNHLKDYYQKNQAEVKQNPNFNQWISINHTHYYNEYTGEKEDRVFNDSVFEATISLKEYVENGITKNINFRLKLKSDRDGGNFDFDINDMENELESHWNSLTGKPETEKNNESAPISNNPTDKGDTKKNQERTEKLHQEIQELKTNNSFQNDPSVKFLVDQKEKELRELENKQKEISGSQNKNTSDIPWNLIGVGGIALMLVLIAAFVIGRKKKNKRL